jgi:SEC-C motif
VAVKTGRNQPCPCGSGKKYKKCHGGTSLSVRRQPSVSKSSIQTLINERDAANSKVRRQAQAEVFNDADWEFNETYALFGSAMMSASNLEGQLILALLYGEFLVGIGVKAQRDGELSKKQYQAELAAYRTKQSAMTMGQLIRRLRAMSVFSEELRSRMVEASRLRNFLVHHFWRERIMSMTTLKGMRAVQEELDKIASLFARVGDEIEEAVKPIAARFNISDEESHAYVEELTTRLFGEGGSRG